MSQQDILGPTMRALLSVPTRLLGMVRDFIHKITGAESELWTKQAKLFLQQKPCWITQTVSPILRCISSNKRIIVSATSGLKTIAQAGGVFTWGIDSDFVRWGLDVSGEARPDTPVEVHEMVQNGDFKTIYGSLGRELDNLCFTQEQVITFVREHKGWLRRDGYATFFLLKVKDKFFVAGVILDADDGPCARIFRFSFGSVWHGDCHHRFVVPQTLES